MKNNGSTLIKENRDNSLYTKKWFGALLLIIGIFGVFVILHRLAHYVYEYDAQYTPIDYGRFNILSYFTVQSNIFVCFYLLTMAAAVFGNKKAQKIAFNPLLGVMVTTYIVITGVVYCCGIPLGFTPPYKWDNPTHSMLSFIQVFHHMIIPPLMFILWVVPATDKKLDCKKVWLVGIYPLVYSIFSIVRGALFNPTFYPYPFYQPNFFWEMLFGDKPIHLVQAYFLMLPVLIVGIMLFILVAFIMVLIYNVRKHIAAK
ncbi:MAG: Pr6Pr family membrane protein [Eubacterium sp.]|nr:Pr6Pr family membrane protein [Eubacterium sp.]